MDTCFIQTKASLRRKKAEQEFAATSFESHKSKRKPEHKPEPDDNDEDATDSQHAVHERFAQKPAPEFNIRRAKQEVIKLGMTGFDMATQEEARVKLAIRLGAKPKKRKGINYKQLLEDKRREKLEKEKQTQFQQLGKNNAGRSTAKGKSFDKKRKANKDILDIYGTVKPSVIKNMQKRKNFGKPKNK